jgi:hypothetical protein
MRQQLFNTTFLYNATENLVVIYDLVSKLLRYFMDPSLYMEMPGKDSATHAVEEIIFRRATECALIGAKLDEVLKLSINEVKSEVDTHNGDLSKVNYDVLKGASTASECSTLLLGVSPLLHATIARTPQQHKERLAVGELFDLFVHRYNTEIKPFQEKVNDALRAIDTQHGHHVEAKNVEYASKMGSTLTLENQSTGEFQGSFSARDEHLSYILNEKVQWAVSQYASKEVDVNFGKGCHADALLAKDTYGLQFFVNGFMRLMRELDKKVRQAHDNHECGGDKMEREEDDEEEDDCVDPVTKADEDEDAAWARIDPIMDLLEDATHDTALKILSRLHDLVDPEGINEEDGHEAVLDCHGHEAVLDCIKSRFQDLFDTLYDGFSLDEFISKMVELEDEIDSLEGNKEDDFVGDQNDQDNRDISVIAEDNMNVDEAGDDCDDGGKKRSADDSADEEKVGSNKKVKL